MEWTKKVSSANKVLKRMLPGKKTIFTKYLPL